MGEGLDFRSKATSTNTWIDIRAQFGITVAHNSYSRMVLQLALFTEHFASFKEAVDCLEACLAISMASGALLHDKTSGWREA